MAQSGAAAAPWLPVGPAPVTTPAYGALSGRITAIAFDPSDETGNTAVLGTAGGGVWRSTNAANADAVFAPLTDNLLVFSDGEATVSLAIGAVAVQPGGTGVLLAGTGEAVPLPDAHYGEGLLRSANDGQSWQLISGSNDGAGGNHSFTGEGFSAFAWGPGTGNAQTVVAAAGLPAGSARAGAVTLGASVRGLFVSADAGQFWQLATIQDGTQIVQSGETDYSSYDGNSALALVWNPLRQRYFAVLQRHGVYSSPNGATWTRLPAQPGNMFPLASCPADPGYAASTACPLWQAALAVNPATGDMFFWAVDADGNDQGLWQDVCAAQNGICTANVSFATPIADEALQNGSGAVTNGTSGLSLAIVPAATGSDAIIIAGAQALSLCDLSTGCLWQAAAPNSFAGVRSLAALPGTQQLLLGTQGGLWSSTNAGASFVNLNNALGPIAQLSSIAGSPDDSGVLLTGAGLLGTLGTQSAPAWPASGSDAIALPQLVAGQAGGVAVDSADTLEYAALGAGVQLAKCAGAIECGDGEFNLTIGPPQVSNDESLPQAPFALDPAVPLQMLVATCRVWRGAADGSGWSKANALSPMFDGNQQASCQGNTLVRSIAAGGTADANGSSVVYAGMQGSGLTSEGAPLANAGHMFVALHSTSGTSMPVWNDISASPVANGGLQPTFNPLQFDVSGITVDPHDPTGGTVYATLYGFHAPHLYYSNNFGASWLNLSSDLPDAPASAVAVDPNNANIVYVAMDTGVYYTQTIQQCASQNCWQQYGAGLPGAAVAAIAADGGSSGLLRAATAGRGAWQIPLASSSLSSQTAISITPASLSFAPQQIDTLSASQALSVTVVGANTLTISGISVTGEFTEADNCVANALAVGSTCVIEVTFAPAEEGTRTGTLTVYGNLPAGQAGPFQLVGTGLGPPSIQLAPAGTLSFGDVQLGQASAPQQIEIQNTGQTQAAIGSFTLTGDFAITQNACGTTLAPNAGCVVSVVFMPTQRGQQVGGFTVTDSAGTQQLALAGTGQAPSSLALSPLQVQFAATILGQASASATITVTNGGDVGATITGLQATGDFSVSSSCGQQVAGNSSCAVNVTFSPTQNGPLGGTLTLVTPMQTLVASLQGTGIGTPVLTLTPNVLHFGPENLQQSSPPQSITVTNTGNAPDTILSVAAQTATAATHDYAATSNCAALQPMASCTITIIFTPGIGGQDNGTLVVTASSAATSVNAQLTGSGNTLAFTAGQQPAAAVPVGQTAAYALQMQVVGYSGTVQMACAGLPAGASCNFAAPPQISQSGYVSVEFTVATGPDVAASIGSNTLQRGFGLAFAMPWLLLVAPANRRRNWGTGGLSAALVCAALVSAGCGSAPLHRTAAPVMPGTYTFTVTASGGGMASSLPVVLVVE